MSVANRLVDGYLRIVTRILWGLAALLVLALLAAGIATPLWLLARSARPVYNLLFLAVAVAAGVAAVLTRRRRNRTERPRRTAPLTAITLVAAVVLAAGALGQSIPLLVIATLTFTIPIAWSLGARR